MIRYERVTYRDGQRSHTVVLRLDEGSQVQTITGFEVTASGDEVQPAGHDRRWRMIQASLVTRRVPLVMSKKYATLVRARRPADLSCSQEEAP